MTEFANHWKTLLQNEGTQNVDVLASMTESGINHFLEKHFTLDTQFYKKEFKKVFDTHGDKREFKVTLKISKALQIQFPPFTTNPEVAAMYTNTKDWHQLPTGTIGAELRTPKEQSEPNFQLFCNEVNLKIEWPRLTGTGAPWSFTLKPFKVFAEACIQLNKDDDGYFLSINPTLIKFDVIRQDIVNQLKDSKGAISAELQKVLDECEEKFTDLFIIAANIAATEQTPKLVRNIQIPVPVIADKPILPALLNLSNNILTAGFALDKEKAEKEFNAFMAKGLSEIEYNLNADIKRSGGWLALVSSNHAEVSDFEKLKLLSPDEISAKLVSTNKYVQELQVEVQQRNRDIEETETTEQINDAYAIGINEYFFDTVASSVIPAPKHDCTGWLNLALAKGRICYWTKFKDPDIKVSEAGLKGSVHIDIGGAIEGCVKKFYDCSWEWKCGKLSLAIKGRPVIKLKVLESSGIRVKAELDLDGLHLVSNLPFPFDRIVDSFGRAIIRVVEAIANLLTLALSFVVLKPEFALPQQNSRIKIRNLSQFYFERTKLGNQSDSKLKFIGYKGGFSVESK